MKGKQNVLACRTGRVRQQRKKGRKRESRINQPQEKDKNLVYIPVLGGGEVGSLQEDGSTVVEGGVLPVLLGSQGTVNGLGDKGLIGVVVVAENGLVLVGEDLLLHDSSADLFLKVQKSTKKTYWLAIEQVYSYAT